MNFKKLLSVILAVVMIMGTMGTVAFAEVNANVSEWDGTSAVTTKWESVEPNSGKTYLVESAAELAGLAEYIGKGNANQFRGVVIELACDIDLMGKPWTPIGRGDVDKGTFYGTFDGNGFTISNLNVTGNWKFAGLFGNVRKDNNNEIRNVVIKNATISTETVNQGYAGALVGETYTTITNCKLTGNVNIKGHYYIGGLIGYARDNTSDCSVEASGTVESTFWCGGGLAGYYNCAGKTHKNLTVDGGESGLIIKSNYLAAGLVANVAKANDNTVIDNIKISNVNVTSNSTNYGYPAAVAVGFTATNASAENIKVTANGDEVPVSQMGMAVKIGNTYYTTIDAAIAAANTMTGDVTVEIYGKVEYTNSTPDLTGAYDSISFVGKTDNAEIYNARNGSNGYIGGGANDCAVTYTDLILSKAAGGFAGDAGFMNVAFSTYRVGSVAYTDCTFPNGACAAGPATSYTGCTFQRSHDKYSLWAYGAEITVDDCKFEGGRGAKMFAEGNAKTTDLTITNSDFSQVTEKPAIVLTSGKSVELAGNTYSSTGVFELDIDGVPNGTDVKADIADIACMNDDYTDCGVMVDGKIYTTLSDAVAAAESGDIITLMYSTEEAVAIPDDVSLDNNGYTAPNVTGGTAISALAKVGTDFYTDIHEAFKNADGKTVILFNDVELTSTIKVLADTKIVLDLNGHTIDGVEKVKIAIMSYGDLKVMDSSKARTSGAIKAGIGTGGNTINVCAGTFTLESGSIYSKNNAFLVDEQEATVTINGGSVTAEPTTNNSAVFYVSSTTDTVININGGELVGYNGILLWNNTEVNITGGSIEAKGSLGIQGNGAHDNTEINISGGSVDGYYAAIYHPQGGDLNISGGSLSGWSGIVVKGGNINISGGEISATGEADEYRPVSSGFVDTGDALYVEHYDNSTNSQHYGTPVVNITGGKFTSANGKAVASYANQNNAANGVEALTGFIAGGTYNTNVADLVSADFSLSRDADGYKVVAGNAAVKSISVEFEDVTPADEREAKVYNIILKAEDNDEIHEFASADLTFDITKTPYDANIGKMSHVVKAADGITLTNAGDDRYMFNCNGIGANYQMSGNEIVIGTITISGFGKYSIATDATATTNAVYATTLMDNLVDTYVAGGLGEGTNTGELILNGDIDKNDDHDGVVDGDEAVLNIPVQTITVNVKFPNAIVAQDEAYQQMNIKVVGSTVDVTRKLSTFTDGAAGYTEVFTVPYNSTYTVEVYGEGYRTARYSVDIREENKVLNFWNNVMSPAHVEEIEAGNGNAVAWNFLAGDIVADNHINIYDLSAVVSYFGEIDLVGTNNGYAKYDLNRDGKIDSKDVAYVLVSWNN